MRNSRILIGASLVATAALAAPSLLVNPGVVLSDQPSPDLDLAYKVKISTLDSGKLVVIYGDGAGPDVYDVKAASERPARDIYVRTCDARSVDCDEPANWTPPVNLSNTAGLSSMSTAWRGPAEGSLPYAGDADKPNVFDVGASIVVTWTDKYCPGGMQRSVVYEDRDFREVPYSCLYAARSNDEGETWAVEQLTDGWRDAKVDTPRGTSSAWAVSWQEDPAGLQLGEGEGPGDGASGSQVSDGTDIWYTWLSAANLRAGTAFPAPIRVTDNFTTTAPYQESTTDEIESGDVGAARPNLVLVGSTALLAYEESKGTDGIGVGKYVRYHAFRYDTPPTSCALGSADDTGATELVDEDGCLVGPDGGAYPAVDDPARVGCILSDPAENARRVRLVAQGTAGTSSAVKLFVFWRQGIDGEGASADIVGRFGHAAGSASLAGFQPADFVPGVGAPSGSTWGDALDGCYIPGDPVTGGGAADNSPALNLSAGTELGGDLGAATSDEANEDARAHRATLSGDFLSFGYTYTSDWAAATTTTYANYEFWMRTSTDGGQTWTEPFDMSSANTAAAAADLGVDRTELNVKEPRLVKTPASGAGCPSGDATAESTTDARDCRDANVLVAAWGIETNDPAGAPQDLSLYVTRSTDKGQTWEPVQKLGSAVDLELDEDSEAQVGVTPSGTEVYIAWNQTVAGAANALYATGFQPSELEVDDDGDGYCEGLDSGRGLVCADGSAVGDCDDTSAAIFPDNPEVCDGLDNDCANGADDGLVFLDWYPDLDGDGFGDPTEVPVNSCVDAMNGHVVDDTDCDDTVDTTFPGAPESCNEVDDNCDGAVDGDDAVDAQRWFRDVDGDGFGRSTWTTVDCDVPDGFVAVDGDCDDERAEVFPGNPEVCDGLDNDCAAGADDGLVFEDWYRDLDLDGFGAAVDPQTTCDGAPIGYVADHTDCDDTVDTTFPGAAEWCNEVDDNCDGMIDSDDAVDASIWHLDADGDTFGDPEWVTVACTAPVGYVSDGTDCDDAVEFTFPGAVESCNDVDDNCDGVVDSDDAVDGQTWFRDEDGDAFGDSAWTAVSCSMPDGFVAVDADCDDARADVFPGNPEVCDGLDNDCAAGADDGLVFEDWYVDLDLDGFGDSFGTPRSTCDGAPDGYVADHTDCDDDVESTSPGAIESCNEVDDDCDGVIDNDDAVDATVWYLDGDGDGFGDATTTTTACTTPDGYVSDATDCDDTRGGVNPAAAELADNELDDDCDGAVDNIGEDDTGEPDTGEHDTGEDDTGCGCTGVPGALPTALTAGVGLLGLLLRRRR